MSILELLLLQMQLKIDYNQLQIGLDQLVIRLGLCSKVRPFFKLFSLQILGCFLCPVSWPSHCLSCQALMSICRDWELCWTDVFSTIVAFCRICDILCGHVLPFILIDLLWAGTVLHTAAACSRHGACA